MKSVFGLLVLAAAFVLVQGYARVAELNGSSHTGVVERVYVEQSPGVYVERSAGPAESSGPVWADVKFPEPLIDGRIAAIAVVPRALQVEPGDRVEMRFAAGGQSEAAALEQNRVTALLQKHRPVEAPAGERLPSGDRHTHALIGM
ncbi:MAG TPA: hypothetical protein VML56_10595 [Burkholderiales bacterium]|nr:hypothetical protein [Burkholderiales bacterium]